MDRGTVVVGVLLASVSLAFTGREDMREELSRVPRIIAFDRMYGVDGPFIGDANPIRGIVGDEAPWVIAGSVHGTLDVNGLLDLMVRGLVFGNNPRTTRGAIGKNEEAAFS